MAASDFTEPADFAWTFGRLFPAAAPAAGVVTGRINQSARIPFKATELQTIARWAARGGAILGDGCIFCCVSKI